MFRNITPRFGPVPFARGHRYRFLSIFYLLFSAGVLTAQPTNDSCALARPLALPTTLGTPTVVTEHNLGATPELPASVIANCTPSGIFSGLGADVWYTFVPTVTDCFEFTVAGLQQPEISIRRGTDCYNTHRVLCAASDTGLVSEQTVLEADSTYYLRVSGANYAQQGYFQLTVDRVNCLTDDGCLAADNLWVSPAPQTIYYQEQELLLYAPETTVNFCYTVDLWINAANNWLHGVQIELGDAWDLSTLQPAPPASCNFNGQWNWYEQWTSCNTGETFGPGFAYDADNGVGCGGTPLDGLPGNNYGDGPGQCGPWEFCWTVSVKSCEMIEEEMSGTDLSVAITALSDGRSGSYSIVACDAQVDTELELATGCPGEGETDFENCIIPTADGSATDVTCVGEMDGTFTINADDGGLPSNVYLYDLNDNLLEAFIGVELPFTSPGILDTGYFGVLLETPDIELTGFCPGYFISIIRIGPPYAPVADYAEATDCFPDSVRLLGSLIPFDSTDVSYDWTGPNDFSADIANPYVTEPGQYILTVNKDGCRVSDTVDVVFSVPLNLQIEQTATPLCAGDELVLTAGGAGPEPDAYTWIVPPEGGLAAPVYDPVTQTWAFGPVSENVELQLVGFDSLGCSDTIGYTVEVDAAADAEFIVTGTMPLYQFTPVLTQLPDHTYTWTFGDGTGATAYAPEHTYTASGTYEVQLIVSNACGADTTTGSLTVLLPPVANFTTQDATTGCGPLTVTFTDQSTDATSYAWTFAGGDPATSSLAEPTVIYATPGTYPVQLTVSNAAGTDVSTVSDYITVLPGPTGDFTYMADELEVQFADTVSDVDAYAWDFGDGNTATFADPVHVYAAPGTYPVSLTITNECGSLTLTQDVTVLPPPPVAIFTTEDLTTDCAPLSVTFTSQAEHVATYAWTFAGGNPATSSLAEPTVIYAVPGTYPVQLTVSNASGTDVSTVSDYITVLPGPTGDFTYTADELQVQFASMVNDVDAYAWDFGDGGTATLANPEHVYAAPGTYAVSLTITNECGSLTLTENVTVTLPAPVASFTTEDTTTGCGPLMVTFTNQSTDATSYAWTFAGGDPTTSTAAEPTVTYATPGTYPVQLTVSNAAGTDVSTVEDYITVLPEPSGSFAFTTDELQVAFTGTAANADSYEWDFGDGNATSVPNPSHAYAIGGTYEVTLTLTNACGTVTVTQTVTVSRPIPEVDFTTEDAREGCAPLTITFVNQSENATSYAWTFPGGTPGTSSEENPTVTYATPGAYTVQLTATNETGANTLSVQAYVNVLGPPTGSFTYLADALTVQFTSDDQQIDAHHWDFGDGTTSNLIHPEHTYAAEGTYTVTLVITNECGSTTITQEISVMAAVPPGVGFTTVDDPTGCAPLSVQFVNETTAADSYEWTFPGGNPAVSTEAAPLVIYASPGTYPVSLTATNANGDSSLTQLDYIEVLAPPFATFTATPDMLTVSFTSEAQNALTYSWDFGDGAGSVEMNPVHSYAEPGEYVVELVVENACGSVSVTETVTVMVTDVAELNDPSGWSLYPNPTNGEVWLEVHDRPTSTPARVVVYDARGARLSAQPVVLTADHRRIPLRLELPAGVYWVRLEGERFYKVARKVVVR